MIYPLSISHKIICSAIKKIPYSKYQIMINEQINIDMTFNLLFLIIIKYLSSLGCLGGGNDTINNTADMKHNSKKAGIPELKQLLSKKI